MVKCMFVKPHTMSGRTMTNKMGGTGMGSVLLNGSAGVAATTTSAAPSPGNLGSPPLGAGLGKDISAKLEKLRVQSKKKPTNIKFSI
jgi:hypothetical protein